MIYINAFIFCGLVCLIGQIILDNTKLTAGHITSMFVIIGALLDTFSIYDTFTKWAGAGAMIPITSFGHSLTHGALAKTTSEGFMGIFTGMFDLTSAGIIAAIVFAYFLSLIFKPKN